MSEENQDPEQVTTTIRKTPMEESSKPTPEQERYLQLVRQLTDASAILVVKVATCKCDKKEECKVFKQAQRISDIIDEIQDIRFEKAKGVNSPAIRRGGVRTK